MNRAPPRVVIGVFPQFFRKGVVRGASDDVHRGVRGFAHRGACDAHGPLTLPRSLPGLIGHLSTFGR